MRLAPLVLLLAACDNPITYGGYQMEQYFPFDGERTWEFVNTDTTLGYKLKATLDSTPTMEGAQEVYSVTYETLCVGDDTTGCTDTWLRDVLWSSDGIEGTFIWGYDTASGTTTYDPPLQITETDQLANSVVTTQTNGATYSVTFHGITNCPVVWTTEWENRCAQFTIDDGGAGDELAGDLWAITQYNVVGLQLADDPGTWQLSYATYQEAGASASR